MSSAKTIIDKYNQHLIKAKAFRDAYNANIEDAEKGWGRKDPGSLGIQGPDVSLHLTSPPGHADAVLL